MTENEINLVRILDHVAHYHLDGYYGEIDHAIEIAMEPELRQLIDNCGQARIRTRQLIEALMIAKSKKRRFTRIKAKQAIENAQQAKATSLKSADERHSDAIKRIFQPGGSVRSDVAHKIYCDECKKLDLRERNSRQFGKLMKKIFPLMTRKRESSGERKYSYKGISLSEKKRCA